MSEDSNQNGTENGVIPEIELIIKVTIDFLFFVSLQLHSVIQSVNIKNLLVF